MNKLIEQDSLKENLSTFDPLDLFCFATNQINLNSLLTKFRPKCGPTFHSLILHRLFFYTGRQIVLKIMNISKCLQSVNETRCYPVIHALVVFYTVGY